MRLLNLECAKMQNCAEDIERTHELIVELPWAESKR